jgi:hypothetical protein
MQMATTPACPPIRPAKEWYNVLWNAGETDTSSPNFVGRHGPSSQPASPLLSGSSHFHYLRITVVLGTGVTYLTQYENFHQFPHHRHGADPVCCPQRHHDPGA